MNISNSPCPVCLCDTRHVGRKCQECGHEFANGPAPKEDRKKIHQNVQANTQSYEKLHGPGAYYSPYDGVSKSTRRSGLGRGLTRRTV